jgi:AcrR family transcriptional regulator
MSSQPATKPSRRSQAERTATTRAALLEATIDRVILHGYASVTSAEIAERAGVTRGALAHHFTSKAELVTAAIRYLADKLIADYIANLPGPGRGADNLDEYLDSMWELYRSPLQIAALDLWVGARTDPDLVQSLQDLQRSVNEGVRAASHAAFEGVIAPRVVSELLSTTSATMRGLSVLTYAGDRADAEWQIARRHLRSMWMGTMDDDGAVGSAPGAPVA